jgi:hypothetical protein
MSRKRRLEELKTFVRICLAMFDDASYRQIAEKTGLCLTTIYRLGNGDFTLAVHYGTIQSLSYAAGLRLESTKTNIRVYLVD